MTTGLGTTTSMAATTWKKNVSLWVVSMSNTAHAIIQALTPTSGTMKLASLNKAKANVTTKPAQSGRRTVLRD